MARVPEPPRAVYPTVASMTAARLLLSWAGFRRRTKYESKKRDTLLPLLSSVLSAAGHSHSFARSLARSLHRSPFLAADPDRDDDDNDNDDDDVLTFFF